MPVHPLVDQLRFARSELERCLAGISAEDARRRVMPMNCPSWVVGHLAEQEQGYWVRLAQGRLLYPALADLVGWGRPASTPPLAEMWAAWRAITVEADRYLETLTPAILASHLEREGRRHPENVGTMLLRTIYHYWFHTGEAHAMRQLMGHPRLPDFVGDMSAAGYRREENAG